MWKVLTILFLLVTTALKAQQNFYVQYHPFASQQAVCLKEAIGGGYFLGSNFTDSSGDKGILITRFDQLLNIVWEKTIDHAGIVERMNSFSQNSNGDIFIVGTADSNALLIRTDSTVSNMYWNKIFNQTLFSLNHILLYSSNSYYVLGQLRNTTFYLDSLILIALDSVSNILWTRSFSTGWSIFGIEFLTNSNGDLVSGNLTYGTHNKAGTWGFSAVNGNLLWSNLWNVDAMSTTPGGTLHALTHSHDNGFLLYGTKQIGIGADIRNYILKCSSSGSLISWMEYNFNYWSTFYYWPDNITAIPSDHNTYTIAGYISPYKKLVLMKVDSALSPLWCRTFEILNISGWPLSLIQTPDNGFLISGTINSKVFLTKIDSLGHSTCIDSALNVTYQPTSDIQYTIGTSQTSGFTSLGYLPNINTLTPQYAIDTLCSIVNNISSPSFFNKLKIFPNPVISNLTFEFNNGNINSISIFDVLGELKLSFDFSTVNSLLSIDVSSLPPGIYFFRAETEQETIATTFIKD